MAPRENNKSKARSHDSIGESTFSCTGCSSAIKTSFEAHLHPLLNCLICRKCHASYGTGDFSLLEDGVDEVGDDNFCRWCCDGGDLFGCMKEDESGQRCHFVFCGECITRNVPDDIVLKVDDLSDEEKSGFKWACYACDPSPLAKLREHAKLAIQTLIDKENSVSDTTSNVTTKKRKGDNASPSSSASTKDNDKNPSKVTPSPKLTATTSTPNRPLVSKSASIASSERPSATKSATTPTLERPSVTKSATTLTPELPPVSKIVPSTDQQTTEKTPSIQNSSFKVPDKPLSKDPAGHKINGEQQKNSTLKNSSSGAINNKPVKHRIKKLNVKLSRPDLIKKMNVYDKLRDRCMKDISNKFTLLFKLFEQKELSNKPMLLRLIDKEIDDLRKPIEEFNIMIDDLKRISQSMYLNDDTRSSDRP